MRSEDVAVYLLALIVMVIVAASWPHCQGEAHAQDEDAEVLEQEGPEAQAEQQEHEYLPPPVDEAPALEGRWVWLPLPIGLLLALSLLAFLVVRRRLRAGGGLRATKGPDKKQCPICSKATDPRDFYPMPRIALPRRVFHLGAYQIILPEPDESQSVEGCSTCYELGMIYARMKHEEFMTIRAKDREREFTARVEAQKAMSESIRKMKNGDG